MSATIDIPPIETSRLRLRAFAEADLDQLAAIYADAETMQYIGTGKPADREDTWRGMAAVLGHWHLRGYGLWAVEETTTRRLVGRIGLHRPEGWPGLEVGWLVARDCWGQGYATEGGAASLRWAFAHLGATHVISVIHPENVASRRVAEKLGGTIDSDDDDFLGRGHAAVIYGYDAAP
jgi:RimJ/RimL family protein N-acetyltransferase